MPVRRTDNLDDFGRFMIRAAVRTVTLGAEKLKSRAQGVITRKNFIVSGTLRRVGHVEPARVQHATGVSATDVVVRSTISFPLVYAGWIEEGVRVDPRFGKVKMVTKEPGFLHVAAVESAEEIRDFIAGSMSNAVRSYAQFRGKR